MAGPVGETLFAEPSCLVALAGVERRRGTANDLSPAMRL